MQLCLPHGVRQNKLNLTMSELPKFVIVLRDHLRQTAVKEMRVRCAHVPTGRRMGTTAYRVEFCN